MGRRTPIAEQQRLVAQWCASGQSLSAFTAVTGIAQRTFSKWTRKHNVAPTSATRSQWIYVATNPVEMRGGVERRAGWGRAAGIDLYAGHLFVIAYREPHRAYDGGVGVGPS